MNTSLVREHHRPFHRRRAHAVPVVFLALAGFTATAGFAATLPDRDHDGVPDRLDLCLSTPRGATLVGKGCSALDLALTPEAVVDPVRSKLDEQAAALESDPAYAETGHALRGGSLGLEEAAEVMRKGDVCRAADLFAATVTGLEGGETSFESAIRAQAPGLLGARDARTGLAEGAMSVAFLRVHQARVHQVVEDARAVSGLARAACGEVVGAGRLHGRVIEVDDASRTFRMEGDRLTGIAAVALPPGLMPGRTIDGRGLRFADGTALLTSLRSELPAPGPALKTTPCLSASVAPFQQFPPFKSDPSEPYRLREKGGYSQGFFGILALESLQRLAAQIASGCSGGGISFTHYTMKIDVTQGGTTWTIANALKDGDVPVSLPSALVIGQPATVTATTFQTTCVFTCSAPQVQGSEAFALVVLPFGHYASVTYDRTVFDVGGNQVINDWQPAKITGLTLTSVPDPNPTFGAMGYKITNNNPADFPTGVLIGDSFAIYETDQLYDDGADAPTNLGTNGVDHVAGLSWPAIFGVNTNGKQFEYSVTLPSIVRDRVFDCAGSLDSFYYLPYTGGYPLWLVIKGNSDDPTSGYSAPHQYALAFSGSTGGDVYAARGGRVVAFDASHPVVDSIDPSSIGNWLSIQHEDGSFGFYFHLAQNGVLVNVGDRVFRDWHIADAGGTGGSKLVFEIGTQTTPSVSGYQTKKGLYEAAAAVPAGLTWVPGATLECIVPRVGDKLFSTSNTL
ncbi:MAG TPA: peptidoglycan DD-metalloendopeptidase family protein [Thermoanaerobaculia bacterium]|nr:peptidoglycan DD-metalloendopeptidase family protein [Thermoanaerobaculia bacterium]